MVFIKKTMVQQTSVYNLKIQELVCLNSFRNVVYLSITYGSRGCLIGYKLENISRILISETLST